MLLVFCWRLLCLESSGVDIVGPKDPSTQCLRTLVPKAVKGMVFGTRVLKSVISLGL